MLPYRLTHVADHRGRRARDAGAHVRQTDVPGHEVGLEPLVEASVGGVALGVRRCIVPAIEVDGGVVGIGGVGHVVPEDSGVVEDARLDPGTTLWTPFAAPEAPFRHQPLVKLHDTEGQDADVTLGALVPGLVQPPQEREAVGSLEGSGGDALEVDVVVVSPGLVHLGAIPIPPPVGLGA